MDVSRKARFGGVKFQRACSLTYGLLLKAFHPAGPDGIRGRGTCLHIGLDALLTHRIVPAPQAEKQRRLVSLNAEIEHQNDQRRGGVYTPDRPAGVPGIAAVARYGIRPSRASAATPP